MTETIIVALITLASGVFGAGIGAFMNLKAIAKESERRIREEKAACYSRFISSYLDLLAHTATHDHIDQSKADSDKEIELFVQFQTAYVNAILICNQSSCASFLEFLTKTSELCKTRDDSGLSSAFQAAVTAMRKELGASED